jgi:hypothetical protein
MKFVKMGGFKEVVDALFLSAADQTYWALYMSVCSISVSVCTVSHVSSAQNLLDF